ncbi:MAG: sugar ABC transporter permease [Deinococcales bacterium]
MAYIFVLPNLLIFSVFILLPVFLNFYISFTGGTNILPQDRLFVGLSNYQQIFDCDDFFKTSTCSEDIFWRAVANTAKFSIFQVSLMVLFSVMTALVLNSKVGARAFFRSVFFYPVLLSPVVVALVWRWILQRNGLLNAILMDLGLDRIVWLSESNWAFFWIIFITIWAHMGFYTLILLAGLQAIPASLYEASNIDGASRWQAFWHITLPMLMPTMLVVLILSLIRAVQTFDEVFIFTRGGPGSATTLMVQYIYETGLADLATRRFGLASAASVILGIALLIFTLIQLSLGRNSENTSG